MLNETWADQYQRMLRSLRRLRQAGTDSDGAVARDALYHFFQDAFHLKDWISSSPQTEHHDAGLMALFRSSDVLAACRDIANGVKHLHLDRKSWTASGVHAEVVGQGVTIQAPVARAFVGRDGSVTHAESTGGSTQYSWTVRVDGAERDALELAVEAVAEWDGWLSAQGLL